MPSLDKLVVYFDLKSNVHQWLINYISFGSLAAIYQLTIRSWLRGGIWRLTLPTASMFQQAILKNQQAGGLFALLKQRQCSVSVFAERACCFVSSNFYRSGVKSQMGPPPAMMEAKIAGVADLLLPASVLGGQPKWREWLSVV